MAVQIGQPFGTTWNKVREGAGGSSLGKADTEWTDDSFDAKANICKKALFEIEGKTYLLCYDNGVGANSLLHLYGLDKTMPVNDSEESEGMFHHGHTAAVGFWNPVSAYHETISMTKISINQDGESVVVPDGRVKTLLFNVQEFDDAVQLTKDAREVLPGDYIERSSERYESKKDLLLKIRDTIKDTDMKEDLTRIITHTFGSYLLSLYEFKSTRFPDTNEYISFAYNTPFYYETYLTRGKKIMYEINGNPMIEFSAKDAISPLWNTEEFPVLESELEVYKTADQKIVGRFRIGETDWISVKEGAKHDDKRREVIVDEIPLAQEGITLLCNVKGQFNILSEDAAEEQLKKLGTKAGSDFKSCEDLRGVFMRRSSGRILGKSYWNGKGKADLGFGAARNAGQVRGVIDFHGKKKIVKELANLQSNKHNTNLENVHPIIKRWIYSTFGLITHEISHCNKVEKVGGKHPGNTTPWNSEKFRKMILDELKRKKAIDPKPAKPTPSSSNTASASAVSAAGGGGRITPTPIPTPVPIPEQEDDEFQFSEVASEGKLVVTFNDEVIARIPYFGQYHRLRNLLQDNLDYLEQNYSEEDVAVFFAEMVEGYEAMHSRFVE